MNRQPEEQSSWELCASNNASLLVNLNDPDICTVLFTAVKDKVLPKLMT